MKNRKTLRLIAGACFAIHAILFIFGSFSAVLLALNEFDYIYIIIELGVFLLGVAGNVLISVSMFTSIPILTTIGSISGLVLAATSLIFCIIGGASNPFFLNNLLFDILSLVFWIPLIIAGINTKAAKSMGIIAGVIAAISFVLGIILNLGMTFSGLLSNIVTIVGALLVGLSLEGLDNRKVIVAASGDKAQIQQGPDNTIERLTRLKTLLDKGVITQEEFETKKKQILGK